MSAIENGLISLYYHFNKIIKGSGTSFQSPVQAENMLEMFVIQDRSIGPNIILTVLRIKKNKHNVTSIM